MRPAVKGMSMAGVNESAVLSYTSQAVGPETGAAGDQFATVLRLSSVPPIQIDCAAAGTDAVEASAKAAADDPGPAVPVTGELVHWIRGPVSRVIIDANGFWQQITPRGRRSAEKLGRPKAPPSVTPHYKG